jgi:formylglycine-generating enzyme required for sulfatase activity
MITALRRHSQTGFPVKKSIWLLLLIIAVIPVLWLSRQKQNSHEVIAKKVTSSHHKVLTGEPDNSKAESPSLPDFKKNNPMRSIAISSLDTSHKEPLHSKKKDISQTHTPGFVGNNGNSYVPQPWEHFNVPWKTSPEKYEKKTGTFTLANDGQAFQVDDMQIVHSFFTGAPLKKTPDDLVYLNFGEELQKSGMKFNLFRAARLYLDSSKTELTSAQTQYVIKDIPETVLSQMLEPFYFRKYEVTNLEYQEFLDWTARHNGYPDPFSMHVPEGKADLMFTYTFHDQSNPLLKGLASKTINIFPDTLAFLHDFPYMRGDSAEYLYPKMAYFSSPSYYNYPVCGITYWQAMAYLDWLTYFYQDYFDRNNIPYKISFALPTDIEWEMAASLLYFPKLDYRLIHTNYVFDNDWVTTLELSMQKGNERYKSLDHLLNASVIYEGSYIEDGYYLQGPADLGVQKNWEAGTPKGLHHDREGISWMDNNVSEWMQESYHDNWLPMYQKHHRILQQSDKEEDKLLALIEEYFDTRNAQDGRLVRGGNYFDERYSDINGKNLAGIMLKRFVSPAEEHSTIGFRYVVRVEKK